MHIQYLKTKSLIPYGNNPKDHPDEQIQAIASSIKNFGFDQPIVVTDKNVIVKGHGRWLAAQLLKMDVVPVIISTNTEAASLANRVLDNQATTKKYDVKALRSELGLLKEMNLLDSTLFTELSIPIATEPLVKGEITLFSLATKHTCPSCDYRW